MDDINDKDFTKEPVSLGEIRAGKSNNSEDISPREMLINILRMIDNGELKPDKMIAVMSLKDSTDTHTFTSNTKTYEANGLAMEVMR